LYDKDLDELKGEIIRKLWEEREEAKRRRKLKKESKEDEEEMYRVMIWREKESKESKELRSK